MVRRLLIKPDAYGTPPLVRTKLGGGWGSKQNDAEEVIFVFGVRQTEAAHSSVGPGDDTNTPSETLGQGMTKGFIGVAEI